MPFNNSKVVSQLMDYFLSARGFISAKLGKRGYLGNLEQKFAG
jgi:hypothetical protein